jgi:hypothetical protein
MEENGNRKRSVRALTVENLFSHLMVRGESEEFALPAGASRHPELSKLD